jgi:methyl-accepting chemotaxis protein
MNTSILKKLKLLFIGFGLLMGIVFPWYAEFFVNWKEGMYFWFVIGCLFAGATIGVVNYWLLSNTLLKPINQASKVANSITQHDFTVRCDIESDDIFGELVSSINKMASSLEQQNRAIQSSTSVLIDDSGEIQQDASLITDNQNQLITQSRQMNDLSSQLSDQFGSLLQAIQHSADLSDESSKSVDSGLVQIRKTVSQMQVLMNSNQEATRVIEELSQVVTDVDRMLGVINSISEQTSLLALNAAIEAARAGEVGRGFAVVADEVRALASKTQASTSEIENTIGSLKDSTAKSVELIQQSSELCQESVDLVQTSMSMFETVHKNELELDDELSTASKESQQQTQLLDAINSQTSNFYDLATQSQQTCDRMIQTAEHLKNTGHKLTEFVK